MLGDATPVGDASPAHDATLVGDATPVTQLRAAPLPGVGHHRCSTHSMSAKVSPPLLIPIPRSRRKPGQSLGDAEHPWVGIPRDPQIPTGLTTGTEPLKLPPKGAPSPPQRAAVIPPWPPVKSRAPLGMEAERTHRDPGWSRGAPAGGFEAQPPVPAFPPLRFLPLWWERGRSRPGTSSAVGPTGSPHGCPGAESPRETALPGLEPAPGVGGSGADPRLRGPPELYHMMEYFPPPAAAGTAPGAADGRGDILGGGWCHHPAN